MISLSEYLFFRDASNLTFLSFRGNIESLLQAREEELMEKVKQCSATNTAVIQHKQAGSHQPTNTAVIQHKQAGSHLPTNTGVIQHKHHSDMWIINLSSLAFTCFDPPPLAELAARVQQLSHCVASSETILSNTSPLTVLQMEPLLNKRVLTLANRKPDSKFIKLTSLVDSAKRSGWLHWSDWLYNVRYGCSWTANSEL